MNILLTNYRYFISGGPERYLFNMKSMFEKEGHHVIPFSVTNNQNLFSEYSRFFLSPLGDGSEVYFRQIKKTPESLSKLIGRNFYSLEAKRNMSHLLKEQPIDVAYILHFLRWISPSILDVLRARSIPIVVRVSDYFYLCPQGHFLRNGLICELCKEGNIWSSVRHRCLQGSLPVSLVNAAATMFQKLIKMWEKVDAIICPSLFMVEKMVEGGFPRDKLHHIPTFVNAIEFQPCYDPGDYFLYFGRVTREKGVSTLVEAFRRIADNHNFTGLRLKIVGISNDGERERLESIVADQRIPGITFLDEQDLPTLRETIRKSLCIVVPSIWYDNMPNVILESYACGKPVIASRLGSLPEIVAERETGFLFSPGDPEDLANCLFNAAGNLSKISEMGRNARRVAELKYSASTHYTKLMNVFCTVAGK